LLRFQNLGHGEICSGIWENDFFLRSLIREGKSNFEHWITRTESLLNMESEREGESRMGMLSLVEALWYRWQEFSMQDTRAALHVLTWREGFWHFVVFTKLVAGLCRGKKKINIKKCSVTVNVFFRSKKSLWFWFNLVHSICFIELYDMIKQPW
jgi:hypothetical protein